MHLKQAGFIKNIFFPSGSVMLCRLLFSDTKTAATMKTYIRFRKLVMLVGLTPQIILAVSLRKSMGIVPGKIEIWVNSA